MLLEEEISFAHKTTFNHLNIVVQVDAIFKIYMRRDADCLQSYQPIQFE